MLAVGTDVRVVGSLGVWIFPTFTVALYAFNGHLLQATSGAGVGILQAKIAGHEINVKQNRK